MRHPQARKERGGSWALGAGPHREAPGLSTSPDDVHHQCDDGEYDQDDNQDSHGRNLPTAAQDSSDGVVSGCPQRSTTISPVAEWRSVIGQTGTATDSSVGSTFPRVGLWSLAAGRLAAGVDASSEHPGAGQSARASVRIEHDAVHGVRPPACRYAHVLEWVVA
jgi:hypothetical protein